jgi:cytosine/adenosine deaminase-related metal-dependent hydrolase
VGQSLLLQHATLIDGTGAPPRPDISIAIQAGRITGIAADLEPPPGASVVDVSGKFVIPGLWDMHVHLRGLERSFRTLVANGITGIRDMYSGVAPASMAPWRTPVYAPRFVVPGMLDGPMLEDAPGAFGVKDAEEAKEAVDVLVAGGAEFIKVYSGLPREAYFAIAEETRRIGAAFAGHVPEAVSPAEAARAGQLSQEHLLNVLLACSDREEELRAQRVALLTDGSISAAERARRLGFPDPGPLLSSHNEQKCADLLETFVDYGVWHTPTLAVLKTVAEGGDAVRRHPLSLGLDETGYAAFRRRAAALLEAHLALAGRMHRAGVGLLAGSDAGPNTPVPLGTGLHQELELLVQAGLTPLEALQTATRNPALYFGTLSLMGTLETGKIADIVVLEANPLEDIRNTRRIDAVVMRGVLFPHPTLELFRTGN